MAQRGSTYARVNMAVLMAVLMLALVMDQTSAKGPLMGGWAKAKVDDASTQLLLEALGKPVAKEDRKKIEHRVCVREVVALEQQVVSGMNYRYHVTGVELKGDETVKMGWCADKSKSDGEEKQYVIRVYEQAWTNTLKVVGIKEEKKDVKVTLSRGEEEEGNTKPKEGEAKLKVSIHMEDENANEQAKTEEGVSTEEKQAIDQWIKDNGLNEFGDKKDRMYLGGTPLFDESTGKRMDRYDYIVSKHPERPWNQVKAEAMSVELAAGAPASGSANAKASPLTIVGVLALMAVFVALMVVGRTRIEQRHAKYEAIRSGRVNN